MNNGMICDFGVLRELRKQRDWNIGDLARLSGVSSSVISKLERNQTRAELETLYRLAKAFDTTLSNLVALAENRTSHRVDMEKYHSGDFVFDRVRYGNMRVMHAAAHKGASLSTPELHRDDYEMCWVLKGKLHFQLPDEEYTLSDGESIQFDALLPHSYEALEDVEMIIVHLQKEKRF